MHIFVGEKYSRRLYYYWRDLESNIFLYLGTLGQGGDNTQTCVLIILQSEKLFIELELLTKALSKC